jgi:hypothetical protein
VFNKFSDESRNVSWNHTAAEAELAIEISSIWSNFIIHGNPSVGLTISSDFEFETFDSNTEPVTVFDTDNKSTLELNLRGYYCDMWNSFEYYYPIPLNSMPVSSPVQIPSISTQTPTDSPSHFSSLSRGGRAGVAIGVLVFVLIVIKLFVKYLLPKYKRVITTDESNL